MNWVSARSLRMAIAVVAAVAATAPAAVGASASPGPVTVDRTVAAISRASTSVVVTTSKPELAVAWVSADTVRSGQAAQVTGGGLTWQLAVRANSRPGDAEAWYATTTGGTITVSATAGQKYQNVQLAVTTYSGAGGIGAVGEAGAETGAPSVSLTPTATGSIIGAVGMDWDSATPRTPAGDQTIVRQDTDAAADTYWEQQLTARGAAGLPATIADTAPTADQWNLAAVEIVPSAPAPTCATAQHTVTGPDAVTLSLTVNWCYTDTQVVSSSGSYVAVPSPQVTDYVPSLSNTGFASGDGIGYSSHVTYDYLNRNLGVISPEHLQLNGHVGPAGEVSFDQNYGG